MVSLLPFGPFSIWFWSFSWITINPGSCSYPLFVCMDTFRCCQEPVWVIVIWFHGPVVLRSTPTAIGNHSLLASLLLPLLWLAWTLPPRDHEAETSLPVCCLQTVVFLWIWSSEEGEALGDVSSSALHMHVGPILGPSHCVSLKSSVPTCVPRCSGDFSMSKGVNFSMSPVRV